MTAVDGDVGDEGRARGVPDCLNVGYQSWKHQVDITGKVILRQRC